ncbi:hypothetical protein D3C81_2313780 [compost metagenome]
MKVKLVGEVPVKAATVTWIGPLTALAGTFTLSSVAVAAVTVPKAPLKRTLLSATVVLKLVP